MTAAHVCVAGCWWEARAVAFGVSRNYLRIPRQLGYRIAELLPFVPFIAHLRDGRFQHRPDELVRSEIGFAGLVEAAWIARDGVHAMIHLCDEAAPIRRGLLALQRDRALRLVGVSPVMSVTSITREEVARQQIRQVTDVQTIYSIDLVNDPAGDGAHILRSLSVDDATQIQAELVRSQS